MKTNQRFEITCITCPIGCQVSVTFEDKPQSTQSCTEFLFSGNQCTRGAEFARTELTAPLRSLTTTVRTVFPDMPVLPVRTEGEVPKEKIPEIIRELAAIVITKRLGIGETVAANAAGTGINIIATNEMRNEQLRRAL